MDWYFVEKGERQGPVTESVLSELLGTGRLKGNSLVWEEGMSDWQALEVAIPSLLPDPADQVSVGERATDRVNDKDLMVQQMREGIDPVPAEGAMVYAGFWWRVLAYFLDGILLYIVGVLIGLALAFGLSAVAGDSLGLMFGVQMSALGLQAAIFLTYFTVMVGRYGATLGKLALRLRVRDIEGRPISYPRALGRATAMLGVMVVAYVLFAIALVVVFGLMFSASGSIESSPALMGIVIISVTLLCFALFIFPFAMCGWDPEKRTLHDRMCGTRVVKHTPSY